LRAVKDHVPFLLYFAHQSAPSSIDIVEGLVFRGSCLLDIGTLEDFVKVKPSSLTFFPFFYGIACIDQVIE
jgi:hypothetical protein